MENMGKTTIDLADDKQMVISKDFDEDLGHPVYTATVQGEPSPVAKIVESDIDNWLSNQTLAKSLQAHGLTNQAVNNALEGLANFHASFKTDENTTFDVSVDPVHESVGVGVTIKF
jgi:hypothetical protein